MSSRTPMVLFASYFILDGNTIHDAASKIAITVEVDEKDVSTFASGGWQEVTGGMKKGSIAVTWNADYADNGLDEEMWAIFVAGVPVTWSAKADQGSTSATNPLWSGKVLVKSLKPLNGGVGDVGTDDETWTTSGAVSRATA